MRANAHAICSTGAQCRTSRFSATSPRRVAVVASLFVLTSWTIGDASATEGGLGRPVAGMSVVSGVGVVATEPVTALSIEQIYIDGSIGSSRDVPVAGKTSLGIDAPIAFTMASLLRVWGGAGGWDFASGITVPYVWTEVTASLAAGGAGASASDRASNLFDLYFTPIIAGYHFSNTSHIAVSFNFWAPTGHYNANALASPSLNNWTFVPQVAYTQLVPEYGLEFNLVAGLQFYTTNAATDYHNAPLFTLDIMALKKLVNGLRAGIVAGTVQQLGNDSGPLADRLHGFRGRDFALGPVITYDTNINGKHPLSVSLRWVPTVTSTNRIKSTSSVMATAMLAF